MFFKEGEKEEMACLGARVAERLAATGNFDPCDSALRNGDESAWRDKYRDTLLFEKVCRFCEFRVEDCEHRSDDPPWDAAPCGGLILLAILLERGAISEADLEQRP